MRRIDSRQKLNLSAGAAVALWLVATVATVLWWRPGFWIEPSEQFAQAQELAAHRRWADSVAAVDRALARDPDNVGYLVFKGYRQLDLRDDDRARESFTRAIAADRANAEARIGLATALARLNRNEEALATLHTLSPDTISTAQLHRRSQLYSQLDARRSALDDLSTALHAEPANPILLKDAAEIALMLEEWDRASSLLERLGAATADPEVIAWAERSRATALEASGHSAAREGRHVDAAQRFEMLAAESEDDLRFRRSQAHALRTAGRLREAEIAFRQILAEDPADVATRQTYAWMLNTQRRYAEAWKVVEPLPRPAKDTALLELQTRTAIWAGQTRESVHLIRALIERRPDEAELWKRLAEAWDQLKDDRQAADALATYVRLQSNDWRARERLAQILSSLGSLEAAAAEYQQLVSSDPHNPEFHRSLGLVQETSGQLEAAAESYRRALDASLSPQPELSLRLARLNRWTGRPVAAVPWYERYLKEERDRSLTRAAEAELALSLLDSGKPADASARLRALAAGSALSAGELVTAARAATAGAQPAQAAGYLELLAAVRPLSPSEQSWLAGMYRAAGRSADALAVYERIAAAGVEPPAAVFEAIGDLRYDAGDFAGALNAFQRAHERRAGLAERRAGLALQDPPDITLKIARSAARAGHLALASETYDRYARARPDDLPARLEAARYHASAGRPHLAIAHYRAFVGTHGAADLRLEMARAHLGAEQFREAEAWAREAVAAGESVEDARLALAQSLHLQGRHRDAQVVLDALLKDAAALTAGHEWRGYIAVALDRHLEAYRSFDRAIAAASADAERLLILRGTSALKRGDLARAADSYAEAERAGATPATIDAARRELREIAVPMLYVPVWSLGDSNDVRVTQAGGGVMVVLPAFSGRLSLEGSAGTLSQRDFSTRVNSIAVTLSQLFPTPELQLGLAFGLNQYDRAPDRATWSAGAVYHFPGTSTIGVDVGREALLAVNSRRELRQFSRVLDVQAIGPGFFTDAWRGTVDLATRGDQRARAEVGLEKFEDGNRRNFVYLHYQIPTASSARAWTAIRPNVFFETFRDRRPYYFSPRTHVTVGTMLHAIRRGSRWEIESEINPQLLHTDGSLGVGGHGLVNIGARIGGASLTGGTFIFWDGLEDHLQWRVGGRISVPLRR